MTTMRQDSSGFSLIETVVAMGILATGLLGLAGVFTVGMAHMATSSANLIAREKAREAVESVHTARDTRTIVWCRIYNVSSTRSAPLCNGAPAAVFLDGPQPLKDPGPDGLVGTGDDTTAEKQPGPDGIMGNTDDVTMSNYTRTIVITNVMEGSPAVANDNLKQIVVTINYTVGPVRRTYTLTTYVSAIS